MYNEKQLIDYRNGMIMMIENACGVFKDEVLDRKKLAHVLTRIANTVGFEVDVNCTEKYYDFTGVSCKGVPHIKISDKWGFTLRIIKTNLLDGREVYRTLYDDHYLMSKAEQEAIAHAEIEADRKMSLYNSGYRDF